MQSRQTTECLRSSRWGEGLGTSLKTLWTSFCFRFVPDEESLPQRLLKNWPRTLSGWGMFSSKGLKTHLKDFPKGKVFLGDFPEGKVVLQDFPKSKVVLKDSELTTKTVKSGRLPSKTQKLILSKTRFSSKTFRSSKFSSKTFRSGKLSSKTFRRGKLSSKTFQRRNFLQRLSEGESFPQRLSEGERVPQRLSEGERFPQRLSRGKSLAQRLTEVKAFALLRQCWEYASLEQDSAHRTRTGCTYCTIHAVGTAYVGVSRAISRAWTKMYSSSSCWPVMVKAVISIVPYRRFSNVLLSFLLRPTRVGTQRFVRSTIMYAWKPQKQSITLS